MKRSLIALDAKHWCDPKAEEQTRKHSLAQVNVRLHRPGMVASRQLCSLDIEASMDRCAKAMSEICAWRALLAACCEKGEECMVSGVAQEHVFALSRKTKKK